jgi:hypothetical protein
MPPGLFTYATFWLLFFLIVNRKLTTDNRKTIRLQSFFQGFSSETNTLKRAES